MFIFINHTVSDPNGFKQAGDKMMKQVPNGLKGIAYYPSTDGKRATCLWEAPTVDALSTFIERNLGKFARNEYFQVNEREAMGLPHAQGTEARPPH